MAKKILIDALQYSEHITGTDRQAHNILKILKKLDKTNEYRVLCSSRFPYIKTVLSARNFKPLPLTHTGIKFNSLLRRVQMVFYKRLSWKKWQPDVYFSFHNMKVPYYKLAPETVG